MERKLAMGLAAVAALGLLLYLRKSGANAATAGTGGVITSNAALLNSMLGNASQGWGSTPVTIIANKQPAAVADSTAKAPAPAPAPAPAAYVPSNDGFAVGGSTAGKTYAAASPVDMNNPWVQLANGQYSGNA